VKTQIVTNNNHHEPVVLEQVSKFQWQGWRVFLVDACLIVVAFFVSYYLRYTLQLLRPVDESNVAPFSPFIPYAGIFMIWVLSAIQNAGLYTPRRGRSWTNELFSIGNAATNAALVVMALSFLFRPLVFSRLLIIQAAVLTIILLGLWRLILRIIIRRLQKRGIGVERVLIVGADELGRHVLRTLVARPDLGFRPVGFVDNDPEIGTTDLGRVPALGRIANLPRIIDEQRVDLVIVTLPWELHRDIVDIVKECEQKKVAVRTVPDLFQLNLSQVQIEMLGGIPMLGLHRELEFHPANRLIKRALDIVLVILGLPIIIPVFAILGLAIRLESKGPILFGQERIGLNGKPFKIFKFRSMIQNAEAMWDDVLRDTSEDLRRPKLTNDPRVTRVGKFIRRTSLDELPNLINVIKGNMSLVGPRPQVRREVELYETWQYQRLKVRPGMTGLWQISGRSDIPFDEMCLLDIYYIENWSLALDLQILLQTAPRVLFQRGAY
jgi:exopolysaccharide biosynthesis polyprenyl glycosylphosphotransferase